MIRSMIDGFLLCFSYFTVLPAFKHELKIDKTSYKAMIFALPFAGTILGIITVLLAYFFSMFVAPLYAFFLASVLYLFLYGFLHLEAIADVIDAWMAKYSNKDVYEIMKEPQVGSIGAVGTFCIVLLKLGAMMYLFTQGEFFFIIVSLMFSRFILVSLNIFSFYEQSSFAKALKTASTLPLILLASFCYLALSSYLVGSFNAIMFFGFSLFFSILILNILKKRFGFLNGDCIGFSIEICELLLLNLGIFLL